MHEAPYSVTFVMGKPPMVTVRAETADGWKDNLDAADKSGALAKIRAINDSLNGVHVTTAAAALPVATVAAAAQDLPAGFANPACAECGSPTQPHPTKHEGTSPQSGKPYKRFTCTTNRAHKNTFINA